jgi:hypothetical protein
MNVNLGAAFLLIGLSEAVIVDHSYLALRIQELDTSPGLQVGNRVVLSLLIVTHGVEAA